MWRRRSPSVMTPMRRPSRPRTPTQPNALAVITRIASDIGVPRATKRHRLAGMHDVADPQQVAAELAARMEGLEIGGRKALAFEERNRQRVAERHHHRRRGGRRQAHRARLGGARQRQHDIRGFGEARPGAAGDRDQRDLEPAGIGDDIGEFAAFAGIGQRQDRVVDADHAEIAVACLRRVDELSRRAGRGERRGDLARDMPAFADAGDDQPAARPRRTDRARHRDSRRASATAAQAPRFRRR